MKSAGLAVLVLCAVWAMPARAADDVDRAPHPEIVKAIRVGLPFYGYTFSNSKTYINLLSVSGGARFSGVWSLEGGVLFQHGQHAGPDYALLARFGAMPTLVDTGDFDGGWTVNAGSYLGYRYDLISDTVLDDLSVHETVHSITQHLALEITRWWPSHVGLDILVLGGLVLPFAHADDENFSHFATSEELRHATDVRVEIGAAF